MYEDADLIVIGNASDSFIEREHVATYTPAEEELPETLEDFYTRTTINIEKVLKFPEGANIQDNSEIDIIEPVAIIEEDNVDKKLAMENYAELEKDHDYIIYLKANTFGEYSVINMNNGKFNLESEEQIENLMEQHHDNDKEKHEELKKQVLERFKEEIDNYDS